jgi:hypothetical protein
MKMQDRLLGMLFVFGLAPACLLPFWAAQIRTSPDQSVQTAEAVGAGSTPESGTRGKMTSAVGLLPQKDEIILELGNPIEHVLSRGARESFRILMTSGQYLRLSVTAHGIGATATLFDPSEKLIAQLKISVR